MIVREAIEEYVSINDKQWDHDRSVTIGASEIGQCARKVWANKFAGTEIGIERDEGYQETWGARWRGNIIENHLLVPAIRREFGQTARFLGGEQRTFIDGLISATPDCLIDRGGVCFLLEFKSIDPRALIEEAKQEHVYQVQVQMGAIRATTRFRPTHAIISYTDASFLNETKEYRVDYDEDIYRRAQIRAQEIMGALSIDEVKPEGWISGGKECAYCAFTRACGRARTTVPTGGESSQSPPVDPQFAAEIVDMARALKVVEEGLARAEEMRRDIQTSIKDRLREKGHAKVVADGVSVSWSSVKGRDGYDMVGLKKAATEAGIDINTYTTPGQPGDRLTVTVKKEKA